MNKVILIGRLTKDVEVKYTNTQTAVANITIAIDKGKDKDGQEKGADFPRVTIFGNQAENLSRYCGKGSMVAVEGKIQTGSYEKDGKTVYTTDIIADKVEFLSYKPKQEQEYISIDTPVPF